MMTRAREVSRIVVDAVTSSTTLLSGWHTFYYVYMEPEAEDEFDLVQWGETMASLEALHLSNKDAFHLSQE